MTENPQATDLLALEGKKRVKRNQKRKKWAESIVIHGEDGERVKVSLDKKANSRLNIILAEKLRGLVEKNIDTLQRAVDSGTMIPPEEMQKTAEAVRRATEVCHAVFDRDEETASGKPNPGSDLAKAAYAIARGVSDSNKSKKEFIDIISKVEKAGRKNTDGRNQTAASESGSDQDNSRPDLGQGTPEGGK